MENERVVGWSDAYIMGVWSLIREYLKGGEKASQQ